MTKARDISSLIGAGGIIDNSKITLDANEIPSLDTAKITTGTFADARISQSSVSQHATTFDDSKIQQDLMVLALQQATDANKSAYALSNSFIEQFEDSAGIDVQTNTARNASEYVSASSTSNVTATQLFYNFEQSSGALTNDGVGFTNLTTNTLPTGADTNTTGYFGSRSLYNGSSSNFFIIEKTTSPYLVNTNEDFTCEFFQRTNGSSDNSYRGGFHLGAVADVDINIQKWRSGYGHGGWVVYFNNNGGYNYAGNGDSQWHHHAWVRSSGTISIYIDGTRVGNFSQSSAFSLIRFSSVGDSLEQNLDALYFDVGYAKYSGASITVPTTLPSVRTVAVQTVNATGNFTSVSQTAPATVSKMGIVVLYKNNAGTATLNTDLIAQVSANNGTDFTTVTLTPRGTFSTGINIAVANNVTVTSGTSCKYKISFANQSAGVKETQVHGIGLLY